jgi:hypothetical protein
VRGIVEILIFPVFLECVATADSLTSSAPADEPQIVELGDLVLHDGRRVSQLGAVVLVVAGLDGDDGAVADVAESDHLEGDRQRLVGPPVRRQDRADEQRTPRPDQFAGMLREEVVERPLGQDVGRHLRVGVVDDAGSLGRGRRPRRRLRVGGQVHRRIPLAEHQVSWTWGRSMVKKRRRVTRILRLLSNT